MKLICNCSLLVLIYFLTFGGVKAQLCTPDQRFTEVDYFSLNQLDSSMNVVYGSFPDGQGGYVDMEMDIYYPSAVADTMSSRPFILIMHGGGFAVGDRTLMRDDCVEFAKKGYVAATMTYQLGLPPNNQVVYRAHQNAHAAMRFISAQANTYGVDTAWLFTGGRSSGSINSLNLIYLNQSEWNATDSTLESSWGSLDTTGNQAPANFTIKGHLNNWGNVRGAAVEVAEMLPMISFHGEQDPLVNIDSNATGYGSRALHNLLDAEGICSQLNIDPQGGHGVYDNPQGLIFRVKKASCFFKSLFCNNCVTVSTTDSIPANCSGVSSLVFTPENQTLQVYPNPANQQIQVDLGNVAGSVQLRIYALSGVLVWQQERELASHTPLDLDISHLAKGCYILECSHQQLRQSTKLIIAD